MVDYDEIEKAFRAYVQRRDLPDLVPSEWFTARDMAEYKGIDVREAQRIIRSGLDAKTLETKKFKIATGTRVYPVNHYRVCKLKKTA